MHIQFIIEDQLHSEHRSEHLSLADAWAELKRLSCIPWNQAPNRAPCGSWKTCGRNYEIIEYDTSFNPWQLVRRIPGIEVNANELVWSTEAPHADT
jgi:hypothetical protein